MFKKIFFPIFAAFLAFRSYEMLKTLWFVEPSDFVLLNKILLSVLLNLFITGIFAFIGFAYNTNRILGDNYYQIKNPKLISKLYKHLKVEYFKMFVLLLFWGKKKNRQKYFDGTRLGLEKFDYRTRQSEFGHLASLIVIQCAVLFLLIKEHYAIAILTSF